MAKFKSAGFSDRTLCSLLSSSLRVLGKNSELERCPQLPRRARKVRPAHRRPLAPAEPNSELKKERKRPSRRTLASAKPILERKKKCAPPARARKVRITHRRTLAPAKPILELKKERKRILQDVPFLYNVVCPGIVIPGASLRINFLETAMDKLRILLAKGRIYESVYALLNDVGISIHLPDRTYFPTTNQDDLSFQVVKPQITSALLAGNKADVGFSGKDWVYENGVENDVVEIMDLGFDPVRIVAAIPNTVDFDSLIRTPVTIATEYQNLSKKWISERKIDGQIFRTWGTSEGFVQDNEDSLAHILIDNTSTGSSLRANNLKIVDTLMTSSTRMYASKEAMADESKKRKIMELKMLFESVLNARSRVMLEMNVSKENIDSLIKGIPAMKSPTVSPLYGNDGFAVKIAVKKSEVPTLLPRLQSLGATDILEYALRKVVL